MSNSVLYHTILLINSTENHNIHIYCKQYLRRFNPFGLRSSQSIFPTKNLGTNIFSPKDFYSILEVFQRSIFWSTSTEDKWFNQFKSNFMDSLSFCIMSKNSHIDFIIHAAFANSSENFGTLHCTKSVTFYAVLCIKGITPIFPSFRNHFLVFILKYWN